MESCWARRYPQLASTLPTVETDRGRHVYFVCSRDCESATRKRLERPDTTGAIDLGDGELRIGRCYNAAPTTIRKSAKLYHWLVPRSGLQPLDPLEAGLAELHREHREARKTLGGVEGEPEDADGPDSFHLQEPEVREPEPEKTRDADAKQRGRSVSGDDDERRYTENPRRHDAHGRPIPCLPFSPDSLSLSVQQHVERAIARTVPPNWGKRHRLIFEFARELKAIDEFRDCAPPQLKPLVREWHRRALPSMRTRAWETTWLDFVEGWDKVRTPKGQEAIRMIFARLATLPPPAEAEEYDRPELRALVSLCRELQRTQSPQPFYLSSRTAGDLLDVAHSVAAVWLRGLCADRVLKLVEQGSAKTGRASRFRYLGEI